MKPEEQRIAIAKACGWRWTDHPDVISATKSFTLPDKWVMGPYDNTLRFKHDIPDYLNDLNAMHEAETVLLGTDASWDYMDALDRLTERVPYFATAAQRAEALLKALNLWEES